VTKERDETLLHAPPDRIGGRKGDGTNRTDLPNLYLSGEQRVKCLPPLGDVEPSGLTPPPALVLDLHRGLGKLDALRYANTHL
jgi:hypothetical protein